MKKKNEPFNIKMIDFKNSHDLDDAFYVRREVFIKEQKVSEEEEFDEADFKSHHVIVYADSKPIATGRLLKENDVWLIGRISVLKEFRGKNAGKFLVEKLLEKAVELGADEIHIHAQTHAVPFYEKFGFVTYGEMFFEAGIEHISMVKKS